MMDVHNILARVLDSLDLVGDAGRYDLLVMAAQETGGYFQHPDPENNWDDKTFQIKAHDIYAEGGTANEAIGNWKKAARRLADTFEEITIAGHIVRGECGAVSVTRMRAACETILGPHFHPKDTHSRQLYSAAKATLQALDTAA